jgi:glycerophosphoryl diester phosphodiesterase
LSVLSPLDRWRAPSPAVQRVAWLSEWAYAHRGLHGAGAPENSPGAFAAAIDRGLGIECDVQRSSDGLAMVFHDFELERLTAESGPISRKSAEQLGQIVISGSSDGIPTLRKVLDQVAGQVPLLIEIKSRGERRINALCLAVRRVLEGYRGKHAVMSFDPRVVRWFADHSALTVRGLVVTEENAKALAALWHARPDFLAYDIRDLPSRFAAAQRKRGMPVLTWTVRSAEHRERAADHADAPIAEGGGVV